jgi:aldose 1-epimerase
MPDPSSIADAIQDGLFELRAGALRLALRADLGGSIAGLWHDGVAVLRSCEPRELTSPRASACFPLAPYSNRLGFRRFRWHGSDHTTAPNFDDDSPHSLHGVAWLRPWTLDSHSAIDAVMSYRHVPDAHWPFAFEVRQFFSLAPDQLRVQMVFTNTDASSQPAGIGWHPYFPKRPRSRLHLESSHRWEVDALQLPTRKLVHSGIDGDVAHLDFDHCFEVRGGATARIRDERFSLQLGSSLPYRVVYTPRDLDFFCVEPVSHVNNAIHMADPMAHGLRDLAAGESFEAGMSLTVSRL